jgi:hypothetical protein
MARERIDEPMPGLIKLTSWGAIFAGSLVAMVILATLTLLGLAIRAIHPLALGDPFVNNGIGNQVWLIVTSVIAYLGGGVVAGRLCGSNRYMSGAMHGLVVFALVTVASLATVTSPIGLLFNGVNSMVGMGLGSVFASTTPMPLMTAPTVNAAIGGFISLVLCGIAAVLGGGYGLSRIQFAVEERLEETVKKEFPRAA